MTTTIVEGVDDEVLLAFVVLTAVAVLTVLYYINTSGQASNSLLSSWQYLRNLFEREFEATTREERQSPDGNSNSSNATDNNFQERSSENRDQEETVQPETSHDNDRINPARLHTEGSCTEGPRHRTGLGASEGTSSGTTQSGAGQSASGSTSEQLSIRIKHHEVERNYVVVPDTTVGDLKRLGFPNEVAQGRRVRFIYSGRLLDDDSASLSFYGITNFSVIHAQISDMPQPNPSQQGQRDDEIELDISRLFIPLLTFILCCCWYGLISYRQLFNTTSTAILVIVTAAYAFMVYVMLG